MIYRLKTFCKLCFFFIFLPNTTFAADYYWVGGTGNWTDFQTHWATTSGGSSFHPIPPTQNDDVFFDQNSFTAAGQVVTLNSGFSYAKTIDWTGVTNNPTWAGESEVNIYGSLILAQAMQLAFTDVNLIYFKFRGTTSGLVVHTFGHRFANQMGAAFLEFLGDGGEWELLSDLDIGPSNSTSNVLVVSKGTFLTNNFPITSGDAVFHTVTTDHVDLGTSLIDAWEITISGSDSTKVFAPHATFHSHHLKVECAGDFHLAYVSGNMIGPMNFGVARFDEIRLSAHPTFFSTLQSVGGSLLIRDFFEIADSGRTLVMDGRFEVLDQFKINSRPGFPIRIQGNSQFVKAGRDLCFEWLYLENSSAGGGANWYAGYQSSDLGGNSGWNFSTNDSCFFLVSNASHISNTLQVEWLPVPSNQNSGLFVNFSLPNSEVVFLELRDTQGRLVWNTKAAYGAGEHQIAVPVDDLAAGAYLGILRTPNGQSKHVLVHH